MKRIAFVVLGLALLAGMATAQSAESLYKNKFSYDLKQNRFSLKFEGKTFWLRMSVLKDDTLTLTYLQEGDTPTTATEFLAVVLCPPGQTLDQYLAKVVATVRPYSPGPPDITAFKDFAGGEQKLVTTLIRDPSNNLVEDDIARLTKMNGQRLRVAVHTKRLKLSEVTANPDLATSAIGDHRAAWMVDLTKLTYPF
jgi:hypothetical protein